jgi:hypothetical protein
MKGDKQNKTPLQIMPYIGPSIAADLHNIGINYIEDLRGKDPEKLYELSNKYEGYVQDKCLLYTYRYAVYFAEGGRDSQKSKWWYWKDEK